MTIETKKAKCYEVSFPVPAINYYTYQLGNHNVQLFHSEQCLPNIYSKVKYTINNTVYNLPNYYFAHGTAAGPQNLCPVTMPIGSCGENNSTYCGQMNSPDFISRTTALVTPVVNNLGGSIVAIGNNSRILYGTPLNSTRYAPFIMFSSPVAVSGSTTVEIQAASLITNTNNILLVGQNPVGVVTTVAVNGVPLSGSFNMIDNFSAFKTAFENKYPGAEVTLNGTNITITVNSTTAVFDNITLTGQSTSNEYVFNEDACGTTLPLMRNSEEDNVWKNEKVSEEEVQFAYKKFVADGNAADFDLGELNCIYNVDLSNSNIELIEKGYYSFVKKGDELQWIDKNGQISDTSLIEELTHFLPDGLLEQFELAETTRMQYEIERRELEQAAAIEELSFLNNAVLDSDISAFSNPLPSDASCNVGAGDVCLLFGANMNAGNSTINNVIAKYSTACDPSQGILYVRKGDKIYFRVHSVTNGNAKINWNPKVEYISPGVGLVTDQNGETPNASQYSDGFILTGGSPVVFPGNGTAQISWPAFTVNNPTDDVYYEIYRKVLSGAEANYNNIPETLIYQAKCTAGTGSSVNAAVNLVTGTNIANIPITGSTTSATTPTVTLFYFRVRSTSNVKWKDFQWRPKVTCITPNTIKNENQTSEGTATFKEIKYPIPDYTIYKSFTCSSAYNQYVLVVGTGVKNIMPNLSGISFSGLKGQLYFVVKAGGSFIGRKTFTINNNSLTIDNSTPIIIPSTVTNLEIGYYIDDSKLSDIEESLLARVSASSVPLAIIRNNTTNALISNVYKANVNLFHKPNQKFGGMYRQWGQFAYNPSGVTGATQTAYGPLIKEEKLLLTDENSQQIQNAANSAESQFQNINLETGSQAFITAMNQYEAANQQLINIPFIPLLPNRNLSAIEGYQEKWQGMHAENYASETASRAATMDQAYSGMDPEEQETVQEVLKTGAYGITRYSTGKGTNLSAGVNAGFQEAGVTVGVQGSKSIDGSSNLLTDYVDLNGDRYPDLVSTTSVQYTTKTGGLFAKKALLATYSNILADYVNSSWGIGASGSFYKGSKPTVPTPQPTSKRPAFSSFAGNNSTGISGNYSAGDSNTKKMWTDINGDGMADLLVRNSLTGVVTVTMNLGNATAPLITGTQTTWGSFKLAEGRSQAVGGGIGFNIFGGSIEAGASLNKSNNHTDFSLIDMNGDGLSDLVMSTDSGLKVRINRGGNFAAETTWSNYNLNNQYQMVTMSTNLGFTFALVIGIPFTNISLKPIDINTNGSPYSTATNNTKKNITDYDGDGFPDLLEETSPGTVMIRHQILRGQISLNR